MIKSGVCPLHPALPTFSFTPFNGCSPDTSSATCRHPAVVYPTPPRSRTPSITTNYPIDPFRCMLLDDSLEYSSSLGRAIHYTPHALFSVIAIASIIAINEATDWFNRITLVAMFFEALKPASALISTRLEARHTPGRGEKSCGCQGLTPHSLKCQGRCTAT